MTNTGIFPRGFFWVNAKVVGLYHSVSYKEGLQALKKSNKLTHQNALQFSSVGRFVLKNFFEFQDKAKHQILGTAIQTKCGPSCTLIFTRKK